MNRTSIKDLSHIAVICALYVALTLGIAPLSFGPIQLRFSEILILLCFFDKKYCWSLSIGCLIANMFSPLGWVDVVFGTLATVLSCVCIVFSKKLFIASLWPTLFNGLIVGIELTIVFDLPLFLTIGEVAIGEFICLTVLGYPIFKLLSRNKKFMQLVTLSKSDNVNINIEVDDNNDKEN